MNSRAYRINGTYNAVCHAHDPENALLWRANPRRLDAEVLRDSMLAISGKLDLQRPRASEVAKAGYTRVQGGMVGDPREMGREMFASMMRTQEVNAVQPGGRPRFRQQENGPEKEFEMGHLVV